MLVKPTGIPDVLVIEPRVFSDERGFFQESFNEQAFDAAVGKRVQFVQDNHSFSRRGVLRGLHYQLPPFSQGKLVRVAVIWAMGRGEALGQQP
jgi:dTDP-4-dehydrorhamnose 3,5-epimerase